MAAAPTIPWEQYQKLPPDQRRRPLTDAEYKALSKQQRISAGLEDDDEGAPANFNGPVFPNPDHIQPHADTDPTVPVTRLPEGVTFQKQNFSGTPPMDVSNPAAAEVLPAMGREVGADFGKKMSAQPIDFSKYEQAAPAGGGQIDFSKYEQRSASGPTAQPSVMQVLTQPTEKTDKEFMGYTGPAGVVGATIHGFNEVARGTKDAIKGAYDSVAQPPQDKTEHAVSALGPGALPVYRMLRSLGHTAADATHVAAAIHDINQSPDPTSHYAQAAEDTVSQGAGQALAALATEGATRAAPSVVRAAKSAATPEVMTAPVRIGARAAETAINQKLVPVRSLANIMKPADAAEATQVKVPGRDFGLKPAETPELDATAENKPFAGEPAPKPAKPLDATGENKPFAGGMDEYTPPKPEASRTIVTDPQTGRPELSDVVAAKQQSAAPVETKAAPAETPAAQPAAKGTPAETPGPAADDLMSRLKANAAQIAKEEQTAPGSADEDLTKQLEDSLAMVRARKAAVAQNASRGASGSIPAPENGVMTTASPKDLLGRWGVDEDSFAQGREQTRGMKPDESAAAVADMTKRFKNGQAVDPVMETRDADNNIVDVDGRGRALAAHKAGVERIPIIVRRLQPVGTPQ